MVHARPGLEYHGLAGFRFYEAPEGSGADGSWDEGGGGAISPSRRGGSSIFGRVGSWLSPGAMEASP